MNGIFTVPGVRLKLDNLTVRDGVSTTTPGAGIWVQQPTSLLELSNTTIFNNSAQTTGGGIHLAQGKVNLQNVTFEDNEADYGGALYNISGPGRAVEGLCVNFLNNSADETGGAIYNNNQNGGSIRVRQGGFSGNTDSTTDTVSNHAKNSTTSSANINANSNFWFDPTVDASTNLGGVNTSLQLLALPTCPRAAPQPIPSDELTLADYGIELLPEEDGWSVAEQSEILAAVTDIGNALATFAADGLPAHVKFKQVMGIENPDGTLDQGFIQLIRVTNNAGVCETENNTNPKTITCGNLVDTNNNPRPITKYVITHEFGHIFDNQSRRSGNATGLREYVATTRIDDQEIKDTSGLIIMGTVNCPIEAGGGQVWLRGERGWQTGPASTYQSPADINFCNPQSRIFTDFQQNPSPYDTDLEANEESGADMFLNWVYRTATGTGFANIDWRPWTCGGCSDATLPGNARLIWTNAIMETIFNNRNWK